MKNNLSPRLQEIVDSLPLFEGVRVLEIGCGPGAAAREIASRIGKGYILGIDRSEKAILQAVQIGHVEIEKGVLNFRKVAIEDFELEDEKPFDLVFAVRVGALDGRHPELAERALVKIAKALTEEGKFFIDKGSPLLEISLEPYRLKLNGLLQG